MRKKLSLLLVMVMALTMVLGTGVCAWADAPVAGCAYNGEADHFHPDGTSFTLNDGTYDATCYGGDYYKKCADGAVEKIVIGENNQSIVMCQSPPSEDPEGTLVYTYPGGPDDIINGSRWYYVNQENKRFVWCNNHHEDITYPHPAAPTKRIEGAEFAEVAAPAYVPHVHSFVYGVITEPTKDTDGLEGEMCACGAVRNTQPISAYSYTLEKYALEKINASKPGQTITFEFGELNSFPKSFMEKLVAKSAQGVTFVFKYKVNHELQTITIPAGTPINLDFDWYGYAKMAELYGEN